MPKNNYPETVIYFDQPITSRISLKPEFKIERQAMRQLESDDPQNNYITKDLQAPWLVKYLADEHIFVDAEDEPMDDEYNFVLTCEENPLLLCSPDLHHSYLGNGYKVLGAGTILFAQGKIITITNNSGHYRPTDDEMLPVIKSLYKASDGTLLKYKSFCNTVVATFPVVELLTVNSVEEVVPLTFYEDILPVSGERVNSGYDSSICSGMDKHRFGRSLSPQLTAKYSTFLETGMGMFMPLEIKENTGQKSTQECMFNENLAEILLIT